eukprot:1957883-Amphidinium_carterae.3
MTECGLMELIPEGSCRVVERAGVFSVPKRLGEPARVIIDRRPRNAVEYSFTEVLKRECDARGLDTDDYMRLRRLLLLPQCAN